MTLSAHAPPAWASRTRARRIGILDLMRSPFVRTLPDRSRLIRGPGVDSVYLAAVDQGMTRRLASEPAVRLGESATNKGAGTVLARQDRRRRVRRATLRTSGGR